MSDLHACGHVRGEVTAREINANYPNIAMDVKNSVNLSDYYRTNAMVFQRASTAEMVDRIATAKQFGITTIYDLDDDFFSIPEQFQKPYIYYSDPKTQAAIESAIRLSDIITVSTPTLGAAIKPKTNGHPVIIVRNGIDADKWDPAFAVRMTEERKTVTIGWMASGSHMIDVNLVKPALMRLCEEHPEVRLHFIGWEGFAEMGFPMDKTTFHNWVDMANLPNYMGNFDIGIAPLIDHVYNRSKSAIKAYQYWALGLPIVVSNIDPYDEVRHGVTGFVAKSEDDWYTMLKLLVEDASLRRTMGMNGRRYVLEGHTAKHMASEWVKVFECATKGG